MIIRTPWQLLQPQLNSYQPHSQGLYGPTYDHLDTLSYVATLPSSLYPPQYFQQHPIYPVGSTTQASQLHLPQSPSHKPPLFPTHIHVQSIPHSNNNKAVQYAYSVELQHLPTFPTSLTLLEEIHTRSREVIDRGVIETMEENEASTWTYPQEDKIYMECITLDEGQTLELEYSPSPNTNSLCILEFDERPLGLKNEEESPE